MVVPSVETSVFTYSIGVVPEMVTVAPWSNPVPPAHLVAVRDDSGQRERFIDHGRYELVHPWPADIDVQGGRRGVVITGVMSYRTAFVEAFPTNPRTVIRGEGATLEEAEDAAWARFVRVTTPDHEHTFEQAGYRNGAGVCSTCGLFQSGVFDLAEIGSTCTICGTGTYYCVIGDSLYCEAHAPADKDRAALLREAYARGSGSHRWMPCSHPLTGKGRTTSRRWWCHPRWWVVRRVRASPV